MPKTDTPPSSKRRPDDRPREIIDAALAVFVEKGFSAARLDDVAARAGLSKAAIYLYFDDKAALLGAVIDSITGRGMDTVAVMAANHTGPVGPAILQLLGGAAAIMAGTNLPQVIKLIVSESRAHPEIGRRYLENVIGKMQPVVIALIERGIASGEFRPVDTDLAVKSLVAPLVLSAIWRSVFEPLGADRLDIEALARQHAELIVRGLAA